MKKQLGPSDRIFPVPAALIVSGINEDAKINPLPYCAKVREYWTIGNLLGIGLNAGKEIKKKLNET